MTTALANRDQQIDALVLQDVRTLLPVGDSTDKEIEVFIKFCQAARLNPWLKECYLVKYEGGKPASIVVGNNFYTKAAAESPSYLGHQAGVIVQNMTADPSGNPIERKGTFHMPNDVILGAWCNVQRRGKAEFPWSVTLEEYQRKTREGRITKFWDELTATMIVKVVETQALRKCGFGMANEYIQEGDGQIISEEEPPEEVREAIDADYREVPPASSYPPAGEAQSTAAGADDPTYDCPVHEGEVFRKTTQGYYSHRSEETESGWCNATAKPVRDAWGERMNNLFGVLKIETTEDKQAWLHANFPELKVTAPSKWTPADHEDLITGLSIAIEAQMAQTAPAGEDGQNAEEETESSEER